MGRCRFGGGVADEDASLQDMGHKGGWIETYLLAQIRAASRASDDNCSYSFDTI